MDESAKSNSEVAEDRGLGRDSSDIILDPKYPEGGEKTARALVGDGEEHSLETVRERFVARRNSFENLSFRNAVVKSESFTEEGGLKSPLSVFVEMLEKNENGFSKATEANLPFSFLDDFIIDAAHPFKVWWDFLVVISIFWTLITVPFQLTFNITPRGWLRFFSITIDVIFGIDTIVSFFTSYYDGSEQITSFFLIAKRYLRTWFIPDIISIFPLEYLLSSPGVASSLGLVRIFRLFRLIKIIRIFRLQHKILNANHSGHLSKAFTSLVTMIFVVFFIAHLYACGFHQFTECNHEYLPDAAGGKRSAQHSAEYFLDYLECVHEGNYFSLYALSLYWTFTSLLTVGYGDIVLTSSSGRLYTLLVVFTGNILFGYLIAIMLEQTVDPNPLSLQNKQRMAQIKKYLQKRLISPSLTKRLMRHFDYYYPRRSLLIEPKDTIQSCPIFLRKELFSILNSKIYSLRLFACNIHLIFEIVPFLHPYLMDSNELLLSEDEYCQELYFVLSGVINAFQQNIHTNNTKIYVGIWTAGSDLNISCAMNLRKTSWATYKSHRRTELLWMDRCSLVKYRDLHDLRKCDEVMKTTAAAIWETFLSRGEEEKRQHDLLTASMRGKSIFKLGVIDHHLPRMVFDDKIVDTSADETMVRGFLPYHRGAKANGSRGSFLLRSSSRSSFSSSSEDIVFAKTAKYYLVSRPSHVLLDDETEVVEGDGEGQGKETATGGEGAEREVELIQIHETSWMMLQRGIINPQSAPKILFDLFVIFCTLLLLVTIPLRSAFSLPQSAVWKIFDQLIQWIFITDCFLSFFTAFERPDFTLNTEHQEIFRKYLQSWFPIDFLSAFPFEILFTQRGLSLLKLFKLLRIIRITRVFKVLKVSRILKLFKFSSGKQTQTVSETAFSTFEDITLRLVSGLMVVGYVAHLLCCGWYYISLHSGGAGDEQGRYSWHHRNPELGGGWSAGDVVSSDRISLYIGSLYFVSATSASVGYGDIIATTDAERLFTILIMLVGTVLVSFVVAQVVHTESVTHSALPYSSSTFQDIEMIRQYLTEQGISRSLTHSVLKHFYFLTEVRTEFDEQDIWSRTPFKYRTFLVTHSYQKIIHQFPVLFHHASPSSSSPSSLSSSSLATVPLLSYLQPCFCLSKSYLLTYETGYDGFYLLHIGAVELVDEDQAGSEILLGNIHPGKIFGESSLFTTTPPPPPPPPDSPSPEISAAPLDPSHTKQPDSTAAFPSELPFLGIRALVDCQLYHLSLSNADLFLSHHPLIAPEIISQLRTVSQATLETAISDYSVIRNSMRLKVFQSHGRRPSSDAFPPSGSGSDASASASPPPVPLSPYAQLSLWLHGTLSWFLDSEDELSAIRYNYLNTAHETMKSYTEKEIEAILTALKNKSPSMILSTNGREKFLAMKRTQDLTRLREDRAGANRRRRKRSLTSIVPMPDSAAEGKRSEGQGQQQQRGLSTGGLSTGGLGLGSSNVLQSIEEP
jgi:CRP-like cAMP-binding protein